MAIAVALSVEMLSFAPQSSRADTLFLSLMRKAPSGVHVIPRSEYRGGADWVMLWGPGHPARFAPMRRQLAAGGHVIAFDLAYYDRDRKVRVSIDAPHPQAWVMTRNWPTSRFKADQVPVSNDWKPNGPVLVAGIGDKARVQYGSSVDHWEAAMIATARARGRIVQYRPKRDGHHPRGTVPARMGPIDQALQGASCVVTWHSNVAVDAIRLGIPVICRDGAAAAVCPSGFPVESDPQPLAQPVRDTFLSNLAWFQWAPASESSQLWAWLREVLA